VNGFVARDLFHGYVVNWIEDTRLHLLDLCKTKVCGLYWTMENGKVVYVNRVEKPKAVKFDENISSTK
jgi:hypothetical protein